MFFEFTKEVKGFRLWHPIEKRCINSRDVIFREQEMYMLQNKPEEKSSPDLDNRIEVEHNLLPSTSMTEL